MKVVQEMKMTHKSLSQVSETSTITRATNPVAIGDELRDHVINLLEARGTRVEREIRIGVKRVDVLAILEDDLEPRRIAVECKNFERNLTQQEVAVVYTEYESLLQTGEVDGIWLIARNDFSPDAKNLANAKTAAR